MNITKNVEFAWDSASRIKYHNEYYTFDILYVSHISSIHFYIFQFLIDALNDKQLNDRTNWFSFMIPFDSWMIF